MKKLVSIFAFGSSLTALVIACTGEDPAASTGPEVGTLGGECNANGSCNTGLSCTLVDGKAKCANGTTTTPADSGASDAGRAQCTNFQPTPSVCKQDTHVNCYPPLADASDPAPKCMLPTGKCAEGELRWECNSANYCGGSCCVFAYLDAPKQLCSETKLTLATGEGSRCVPQTGCSPSEQKLCAGNIDCPSTQHCSPARVLGNFTIQNNIVGVCVD